MTEEINKEETKVEETKTKEKVPGIDAPPPPDFSSFIFSISTTVLMDLGEIEHPIEKKMMLNLVMAKHSIDVLDMLKEKTKGNLTESEKALIENIVTDLKLRYFKKTD